MLTDEMKQILKAELLNDPQSRGYLGKTNQAVANLLNAPYQTQVITYIDNICRTSVVFNGVAAAPNSVTAGDVADAMVS